MIIGVPKEIKPAEFRVAITPVGVRELVDHGHQVIIETEAGEGSTIHDEEYVAQGAAIVPSADEVFSSADLILKVKEPQAVEVPKLRPGQLLFTYLHLAAYPKLAEGLLKRGIVGIAYETVQLPDHSLPSTRSDVGSRRPHGYTGGRLLPREGPSGPGSTAGRSTRRDARQGCRHRRRHRRHECGGHGHGTSGNGGCARQRYCKAARLSTCSTVARF